MNYFILMLTLFQKTAGIFTVFSPLPKWYKDKDVSFWLGIDIMDMGGFILFSLANVRFAFVE